MSLPEVFERVVVNFPPAAAWNTWVLSDHYQSDAKPPARTYLGELVYQSKYCGNQTAATELASVVRHCVRQLRCLPLGADGLGAVTAVAAVPCNPPKRFSVPRHVAAAAATALDMRDLSQHLVKVTETAPSKTEPRLHPSAYEVRHALNGETILLVDDLFRTGTTLESVAGCLRTAGVVHVVGLCITKAHKGMVSS